MSSRERGIEIWIRVSRWTIVTHDQACVGRCANDCRAHTHSRVKPLLLLCNAYLPTVISSSISKLSRQPPGSYLLSPLAYEAGLSLSSEARMRMRLGSRAPRLLVRSLVCICWLTIFSSIRVVFMEVQQPGSPMVVLNNLHLRLCRWRSCLTRGSLSFFCRLVSVGWGESYFSSKNLKPTFNGHVF